MEIIQSNKSGFRQYLERKALSKSTIKTYNWEVLHFITWCDKENIEAENCTITEVTGYLKHAQNKGKAKRRAY